MGRRKRSRGDEEDEEDQERVALVGEALALEEVREQRGEGAEDEGCGVGLTRGLQD